MESDLQELCDARIPEGLTLEFKETSYSRAERDTREMLRDISSFANSSGGHIVIGISDKGAKAGELIGIDNAEEELARITSTSLASIQDRIFGLDFHIVSLSSGREAIVLRVPRSARRPHMVSFRGENRFWKRHGNQKSRMTVDEIRELFNQTSGIQENIEKFLEGRRGIRSFGDIPPDGFQLSSTPLSLSPGLVNPLSSQIKQLFTNPPYVQEAYNATSEEMVRPFLHGASQERENLQRLEVWRNGHVELSVAGDYLLLPSIGPGDEKQAQEESLFLDPYAVCGFILSFLHFSKAVYEQSSIYETLVIRANMPQAIKWVLREGHPKSYAYRPGPGTIGKYNLREGLYVELFQVSPAFVPGKVAAEISDRIWNAFGIETCPMFDDNGELIR